FFSSSRQHTSFSRDWSSDVCSSDLNFPRSPKYYFTVQKVGLVCQSSTGGPSCCSRLGCRRDDQLWDRGGVRQGSGFRKCLLWFGHVVCYWGSFRTAGRRTVRVEFGLQQEEPCGLAQVNH